MPVLLSLGPWSWLIAAAFLLIVEILAPGIFMLWLGIAALVVGLLCFVIDWSWQWQFATFAVLSLAAIPLWRRLAQPRHASDQPFLNRRLEAMVGRVFTLDKPIVGGIGTIGMDDTVWRVTGEDAPAGSRIKIVRIDGATIHVERIEG